MALAVPLHYIFTVHAKESEERDSIGYYIITTAVTKVRNRNHLIYYNCDAVNRSTRRRANWIVKSICTGSRQSQCRTAILGSLLNSRGKVLFAEAPGGTGKTILEKTILARIRSEGKYALAVASSGIAALLLPKGRTAHSWFKIPIDIFDDSTCNVPKQGQLAELFRMCDLIVWDEAPMQHRRCFQLVDRMLQDVRSSTARFGGLTVVLAGDPKQCLPVIPKSSPAQIVDACIMNADLEGSRAWKSKATAKYSGRIDFVPLRIWVHGTLNASGSVNRGSPSRGGSQVKLATPAKRSTLDAGLDDGLSPSLGSQRTKSSSKK
ncbi:BZ3500_MvSof-1268-A1-R1_Chr12-2g03772 [Microbotryum saponariae]|uniref:ATP-dependent DNA helicase n=1 Tax=Microbotryum saponariae TaxID=289078 RepID=A0A2X0MQR3_9BASI|nr:BZ3500_MvSof-1268-A1-R1_Chr12-2g03772 [Microbotryum saponariae]